MNSSATNPAQGMYRYLRDIVIRARVGDPDLKAVVSAGCEAYAEGLQQRGSDTFSFDGYIAALFVDTEAGLDQALVDRAVTEACGAFKGDVRRFVEDLSGSLGIGLDDLRRYMASACAGFRQRERANASDPYAPKPFDPIVSSVFAEGGLDRADLTALVNAACRDLSKSTTGVSRPASPRD